MVDPTTIYSCLSVPIRGSDVGTWDLPVNANTNAIDSMFGGVTSIVLAAANVTMTSTQGQSAVIRLTGTLANNVNLILSPIIKGWTIDNQITNSPSSFAVAIVTPGSTYALGSPPGHHDIFYDGSAIYHRNMGRVGEYWDYASSGVPTWVTVSTKPPWLNCNGTTFSSATYPILNSILGSTTLPDTRGRARMAMNQGTSRVTVFNGDTLYLGGGDQQVQSHDHGGATGIQSASHTHSATTGNQSADHTHNINGTTGTMSADHTHSGTTLGADRSLDHLHANPNGSSNVSTTGGGGFATGFTTNVATGANDRSLDHLHTFTTGGASANHTHSMNFASGTVSANHTHSITATSSESTNHTHTITSFGTGASLNMPPRVVHGITLIRAA